MTHNRAVPDHWGVARLNSFAEVRLGRQRSPKRATGDHMRPYMRAANVTWDGISLADVKTMDFTPAEFEIYGLKPGDILLAEASGSASEVGKPAIWQGEVPGACFQNTLIRVRAAESLVPFLHLHFRTDALTGRFATASRGVGIHHLGAAALSGWEVSLPPLGEQQRLVAEVESYLSRLDDAVRTLERVQRNLKRYRASVLKAAVEGRLVPTEAELARREGRDYEPADVLLARILKERRTRWIEQEADKARTKAAANAKKAGKPWTKADDKAAFEKARTAAAKKYKEPAPPDTTGLPGLPEGWCWTNIDAIADVQGGLAKGKKRKPDDKLRRVPYLRVANVQRGWLDLTEVKTIDATDDEVDLLTLRVGDVLFNEGGDRDKLGRGWVWGGEIATCIHQNHVFRARLRSSEVLPKYVSRYANSTGQQYFLDEGKQTTNLASISLSKLRDLPVPLPPVAEQNSISAEVERLLSIGDDAERDLRNNMGRCARLRQAILRWAFEGRLVDQDPDDEPAAALLERIKAERAAAEPNGQRKRNAASATRRRKSK